MKKIKQRKINDVLNNNCTIDDIGQFTNPIYEACETLDEIEEILVDINKILR